MAEVNPFIAFFQRYKADPVLFVKEQLHAEPDLKQCELMMAVARGERRVSMRSGHGVGKTTALAWLIIWHILVFFPQKTVATAPTSAQLFDALASETFAWVTKLPATLRELLEVTTDRITLRARPDESFVSFRTSRPDTPEALAGVHSNHVLLLADEASGIPEKVFEAASGSMSGHSATTILTGNPVRTSGLFFDTFHKLRSDWFTLVYSCADCPRVSPDYVSDMAKRYGEKSNGYRVRVLGEFPLADDNTIIPFELMEASLARDVKSTLVAPIWGLDCARFGRDDSALAKRRGNTLLEKVIWWNGLDTMELCGRVKSIYDQTKQGDRPSEICVDAIGIGAGVADRLRELGLPARSINVSESPSLVDQFRNLKAELWWNARDWFWGRDCSLAGDERLGGELVAVQYSYTSSGKIMVESKDEMRKRGLPSPDRADAFVLSFAGTAISAASGVSQSWKTALKRGIKGISGIRT